MAVPYSAVVATDEEKRHHIRNLRHRKTAALKRVKIHERRIASEYALADRIQAEIDFTLSSFSGDGS